MLFFIFLRRWTRLRKNRITKEAQRLANARPTPSISSEIVAFFEFFFSTKRTRLVLPSADVGGHAPKPKSDLGKVSP